MVLSASLGARPVLYEAPGWGVGELWLDGDTVVWHEAPTGGRAAEDGRRHPLADRLVRFFRGEPDPFDDVELDLEELSPFHRELAALAGRPNAQRAAGTFCATNRLAIFVPCHRVVAADGIGSYGSLGVDYKRRLLALEGVAL